MSAIRTKIFRKSKHMSVSDSILRQLRNAIADGGNLVRNTAVESIQSHLRLPVILEAVWQEFREARTAG